MTNLAELIERYSKEGTNGLGISSLGYYEINSNKKLSLNSYSGFGNFILNDNGEVQIYDMSNQEITGRIYYEDENWEVEVDYETEHFWERTEAIKEWGKTLDKYYPHPWYPEKEIVGFTIVNRLPMFDLYEYCEVDEERYIRSTESWETSYHITECLKYPEWFKPIYKD